MAVKSTVNRWDKDQVSNCQTQATRKGSERGRPREEGRGAVDRWEGERGREKIEITEITRKGSATVVNFYSVIYSSSLIHLDLPEKCKIDVRGG